MQLKRAAAAAIAGFLAGTFAPPLDGPAPQRPSLVEMTAEPLALYGSGPDRPRIGGLRFIEGWHLASRDVRFGGVSAMHVEGGEVTALSDSGSIFRFPVPARAGGLPLRIEPIPRGPGSGRRKSDRDAEALAVAGDRLWVSFEGRNAIWAYRRPDWRFEAAAAPEALRGLSYTRGAEAMARLEGGRFLLFAEGPRAGDGTTPVFLFEGDPALAATPVLRLRYRAPKGYRPTEAAQLPDGRVLVLNRDFGLLAGWRAMLTVADPRDLRPGAVLEGRLLAELGGRLPSDNMEALSVKREGDRTIVWVASDDNFLPLVQRTLLLKFELIEDTR